MGPTISACNGCELADYGAWRRSTVPLRVFGRFIFLQLVPAGGAWSARVCFHSFLFSCQLRRWGFVRGGGGGYAAVRLVSAEVVAAGGAGGGRVVVALLS